MRQKTERELWFLSKIGRRLYRNSNGCTCPVCANVLSNGLIVADEMHATYLYDIESEYNYDGHPLKYQEEPLA